MKPEPRGAAGRRPKSSHLIPEHENQPANSMTSHGDAGSGVLEHPVQTVKTVLMDPYEAFGDHVPREERAMTARAVRFILLVAAIGFLGVAVVPAWGEGGDEAALAAAMKNATATLEGGLKTSEAQGTPISAKFEIEDGR